MPRAPHVDSYYAATANDDPIYPELCGDVDADVCVVGAGYTGLSTALELAERGYAVAVLEAARVGWGASGRNGGHVCTGLSGGLHRIEGWVGRDDARKLFAIAQQGKEIIRDRVARHGIDCDLRWGYFHAALRPRHLRELATLQEAWATDYGYTDTRRIERREVAAHVASPAYIGGLYEGGAGHLHPLNYCLGLARAAERAGVRVYEGARVARVVSGPRPIAQCASGRVRARFLVLCGNAYLGDLVPEIAAKIMPVGSFIGATVPLGQDRARALIPGDAAVADCNHVLNYYRRSADHRLLFGGRVSTSAIVEPNLPRALRRKMLAVFPALHDVAFAYTWGGHVALTVERTPHVGRLGPNVYFAQGYSGQGVVLGGVVGRLLAEAISGQAERMDLLARLPHSPFPGGDLLRKPALALAMLWFRLKDAL